MTSFQDGDVTRLDDSTTLHRNRMEVVSPDSDKRYTISQRTTDLVWCCSCWSWRRSQPHPCKHLLALGLVNGVDEPAQVVIDKIGKLRWTVQQLRAKIDGPPRSQKKRGTRRDSSQAHNSSKPMETPTEPEDSRQPSSAAHSHATLSARLSCPECRLIGAESPADASRLAAASISGIAQALNRGSTDATSHASVNGTRMQQAAAQVYAAANSARDVFDLSEMELAFVLFHVTAKLQSTTKLRATTTSRK